MSTAEPIDSTLTTKRFTSGFAGGMAIGIMLILIGGVIIVSNWPSTDVSFGETSGSLGGVAVGCIFAVVGQLLFLVYAVAQAVFMGVTRAADREADILRP